MQTEQFSSGIFASEKSWGFFGFPADHCFFLFCKEGKKEWEQITSFGVIDGEGGVVWI